VEEKSRICFIRYGKTRLQRLSFIRVISLSLLFICVALSTSAQYYDTGEEPSWIRWRQIQSKYFKIIYPSTLDSVAFRYAWLFDSTAAKVSEPMQIKPAHIPVILHPYNVSSNGMVAWAPSRMELITTPPVNGYPQAWDKQLVLHETRHVAQMSKIGENVIRIFRWIIGEQAEGLTVGMFIPTWFMEGDATVSETAMSSSGRGRSPVFLMPHKAFLLDGMDLKWDTWKNGSYRYPIPRYYELGYILSSYSYLNAGEFVFGKTIDYTTRKPYALPPFGRGLEKNAGLGESDIQKISFNTLKNYWQKEDSLLGPDILTASLTKTSRNYTAYRYPVITHDNRIIALRNTMSRSTTLVQVKDSGKIKNLRPMGAVNSRLHYNNNLIYWTEIVPHVRWPQQSFSVIKWYDPRTRKVRTLTHKTRYFDVNINPDGTRLSTIENTPEGLSRIAVIPLARDNNGNPLLMIDEASYIPAKKYETWKQTVWTSTGELAATLLTDLGIGLYSINIQEKSYRPLINNSSQEITRLSSYEGHIVFESGYNGVNNMYAFKLSSGEIFRLTNAKLGAFDATFNMDKKSMVYSNYHTFGYRLSEARVDNLLWKKESFAEPYRHAWADSLSAIAKFNIDSIKIPENIHYESKPYRKRTHLFRFHSWAPIYINPDEISNLSLEQFTDDIGLGVTLFSQNNLNTAFTRLGYKFSNGFHSGHIAFTYKGWCPIIELNVDFNERKAIRRGVNTDGVRYLMENADYPYLDAVARIYIPLNFSSNGWQRGLIPQIEKHFTNDSYTANNSTPYHFQYLLASLIWYDRLYMATQELYPRWGYMLRFSFMPSLFSGNHFGHQSFVQLTTYVPGLFTNHGLRLRGGYQWQNIKGKIFYLPLSLIPSARGYNPVAAEKILAFNADYAFPLLYPDLSVSGLAYIKRIYINAFADHSCIIDPIVASNFNISTGFDFMVDCHLLRFEFPIQMGLRCAFPLTDGLSPTISFLLDMTFK
jgi:hypothetical protein